MKHILRVCIFSLLLTALVIPGMAQADEALYLEKLGKISEMLSYAAKHASRSNELLLAQGFVLRGENFITPELIELYPDMVAVSALFQRVYDTSNNLSALSIIREANDMVAEMILAFYYPDGRPPYQPSTDEYRKYLTEAGTLLLENMNYLGAQSMFEEAINGSEDVTPELHYGIAQVNYFIGDEDEALIHYNAAIALNSGYVDAYIGRAQTYSYLANDALALESYTQAIKLDSGRATAYYERGVIYSVMGKHRLAITDFSQAIDLVPDYASAYYWRGISYYYVMDYGLAIIDFTRVINLNPMYEFAYYWRGQSYLAQWQNRKAIEDFNTLLETGLHDEFAYYGRAIAYVNLGRHAEAQQEIDMLLTHHPEFLMPSDLEFFREKGLNIP